LLAALCSDGINNIDNKNEDWEMRNLTDGDEKFGDFTKYFYFCGGFYRKNKGNKLISGRT